VLVLAERANRKMNDRKMGDSKMSARPSREVGLPSAVSVAPVPVIPAL
jgi:hypothetical protein